MNERMVLFRENDSIFTLKDSMCYDSSVYLPNTNEGFVNFLKNISDSLEYTIDKNCIGCARKIVYKCYQDQNHVFHTDTIFNDFRWW